MLEKRDAAAATALLQRAPGLAGALNAKNGDTALHAAVRVKSMPLVQLLVKSGADVAAVDRAGRTAEALAAADGAAGMAALLAEARAAHTAQSSAGREV